MQIAHGYAKATGKPMIAIVHNIVGMLHATTGIYYAYIDRRADLRHRRDRTDGRGPPVIRVWGFALPRTWERAQAQ